MASPVGLRVRAYGYKNGLVTGWKVIKAYVAESYGAPIDANRFVCTCEDPSNPNCNFTCVMHYPEDFVVSKFKIKPKVEDAPPRKPLFKLKGRP